MTRQASQANKLNTITRKSINQLPGSQGQPQSWRLLRMAVKCDSKEREFIWWHFYMHVYIILHCSLLASNNRIKQLAWWRNIQKHVLHLIAKSSLKLGYIKAKGRDWLDCLQESSPDNHDTLQNTHVSTGKEVLHRAVLTMTDHAVSGQHPAGCKELLVQFSGLC